MKMESRQRSMLGTAFWFVLGASPAASAQNVFDVSRSSRIVCPNKNDRCVLNGSIGSDESFEFSINDNGNIFTSNGQKGGYLLVSSCWNFDCTAECDASCSCVRYATGESCPTVSGDDTPTPHVVPNDSNPSIDLTEPHLFLNLQDIRLECTESNTKCILSGFERCGYTAPRYNLYNDLTGLFVIDNAHKGDTTLEIRACNPVLGTADCDAGCTCHDLATHEPCDARVLPPHPAPPSSIAPPSPKIVFSDLSEATLTCHAEHARCDEVVDPSRVCGASSSGETSLYTTYDVQPATMRVDKVGVNEVTFSSCYRDTYFAMECDASCSCMDSKTHRPCKCTNSTGGSCPIVLYDELAQGRDIVTLVWIGGSVILVFLVRWWLTRLPSRGKGKAGPTSHRKRNEVKYEMVSHSDA